MRHSTCAMQPSTCLLLDVHLKPTEAPCLSFSQTWILSSSLQISVSNSLLISEAMVTTLLADETVKFFGFLITPKDMAAFTSRFAPNCENKDDHPIIIRTRIREETGCDKLCLEQVYHPENKAIVDMLVIGSDLLGSQSEEVFPVLETGEANVIASQLMLAPRPVWAVALYDKDLLNSFDWPQPDKPSFYLPPSWYKVDSLQILMSLGILRKKGLGFFVLYDWPVLSREVSCIHHDVCGAHQLVYNSVLNNDNATLDHSVLWRRVKHFVFSWMISILTFLEGRLWAQTIWQTSYSPLLTNPMST